MAESLSTIRFRRTRALAGCIVAGLVIASPFVLYRLRDPEQLDLNNAARATAPGAFVRLANGYTHYEVGGPAGGRTVVLVAGFSVPYYLWDPTFNALVNAGFRVLRYDFYGRGYSDRPDIPYTQDLYVRQLVELLDVVGFRDPVDLTGVSMGAAVITTFADKYPSRVRSLVYVDPSFRGPYMAPYISTRPRLWSYMTAILDEPGWADEQLADFFRPERFGDWPAKYRVQMQYRGFRRARLSEIVNNVNVDQEDEIARVGTDTRPVLLIWGKEDRSVPFELSEGVLQMLPYAVLVAVDEAGHLPQMEQPKVFNDALLDFLR